MSVEVYLSYVATVALIVFAPGPSVLLVGSHRMQHGPSAVWPTVAGDLSANVLQMTAAAVGLAAIIQRSAFVLEAIKWFGVAYLIYLGIGRLIGRVKVGLPHAEPAPATAWHLFRRAFTVSAANPKAVAFFAGLFPLFLEPSVSLLPQMALLGGTFLVLDGTALVSYASLGNNVKMWLRRRGVGGLEDRVAGFLLLLAALGLAGKRITS